MGLKRRVMVAFILLCSIFSISAAPISEEVLIEKEVKEIESNNIELEQKVIVVKEINKIEEENDTIINTFTDEEIITNASDRYLCEDEYLELAPIIMEASLEFDVPFYIISNVIYMESRYQNIDKDQYIGLMQISEILHSDRCKNIGYESLHDPEANINTGTNYLRELFDKYFLKGYSYEESWALALSKYHGEKITKEIYQGQYSYYVSSII